MGPISSIEVTGDDGKNSMQPSIQLGTPHMATIMILDDDHGGIFGFEDSEAEIVESVGVYELKVQRISGARGKVAIPFSTEDGSAKAGSHYESVKENCFLKMRKLRKSSNCPSRTRKATRRAWSCTSTSESLDRSLRAKKERALITPFWTQMTPKHLRKKRRLLCWVDHVSAQTRRFRSESESPRSSRTLWTR